ncbi:MAG: thiolase family protein [bacterium]
MAERNEAYIVSAVRTAVGRRGGALSQWRPEELLAEVLKELVKRAKVSPECVEDVVCGIVYQVGEQAFSVPRMAVHAAGFPDAVPGMTCNRQCGSSLSAIQIASSMIQAGHMDCVVACGVEIMSKYPIMSDWFGLQYADGRPAGTPFGPSYMNAMGGELIDQGQAAERIAKKWGLNKQDLDAFSLRSHQRAHKATVEGRFKREILPLQTKDAQGNTFLFEKDEPVRADTSMEKLASLKTVFNTEMITAGNSSPITDGASAVLLMSGKLAKQLGIEPRARIVVNTAVGSDPKLMLTGPIQATPKALQKAGLKLQDMDVVEINEAFAPIPLAWGKVHKADWEKVNINGGAIALGHPVGNSGCRLTVTALHELERTKGRYGLITLCTGGAMAPATIIERI